MARSHLAWHSARPGPPSRTAKRLSRPLRATLAAAAAVALAGAPLLAGPAAARQILTAAPAAPLQLSLISFSPSYAEPGHTITVTGRVRNATSSPVSGLSVQAWSSRTSFGSRTNLENFAHGTYHPVEAPVTGAPAVTKHQLDAGHSWVFTLRLPASALGLSCFGVYPLTIQVSDPALQVAREPVPLPYWPSSPAGCAGAQRPKPFPVSWVWPLVDVPHQGVCHGLTDNKLATSLGPAGRLGYLLAVGRKYARSAALTWAVDPALLDSASAMRGPHDTGFSRHCNDLTARPPSKNARQWLASLAKSTAGRPLFVTPYADVDAAALAKYGDNADLTAALAAGNKVARKVLGRRPAPASGQPGGRQLSALAWPPGGHASEALLDALRASGAGTVILTAPATSASTFTPGAVTSKLAGIGKYLHVLLADHPITTLLGSRQAASANADDIFRVSQLYLAQTAMIAAEAPASVRPIVIAPPRRWNPPRRLASALLAETVAAPWLAPSTANRLASMRPEHLYPRLTDPVSRGELSKSLLMQVDGLEKSIALLQSIQVRPDPDLNRAVFAIESSAWRGDAGKHAKLLLVRTERYVKRQLGGLSIRGSNGKHSVLHVTFGGRSSSVPVAVYNKLPYPVLVKLQAQASNAKVSGLPRTITVPPLSYSPSVKITVHTSKNSSRHGTIKLSLSAPNGQALPAYPLTIIVHTTDLGIIALGIGSAALALFVIASAMRAIRAGRSAPAAAAPSPAVPYREGPEPAVPHPAAADEQMAGPEVAGPEVASPEVASTDAEVTRPAPERLSSSPAGRRRSRGLPAEPASRSGRQRNSSNSSTSSSQQSQPDAEFSAQGLVQPGRRPEHIDSVGANGSKPASTGPPADQETTPGLRGNREHP